VQFFPYPELEIKKYAQGQKLLIFGVFFEKLAHCAMDNSISKKFKSSKNRRRNKKKHMFLFKIKRYVSG
jgi:hypothetical protein